MNPLGLLMAYAEENVTPVVSDFDTFLVGSKGMRYEPTPPEQARRRRGPRPTFLALATAMGSARTRATRPRRAPPR